MNGLNNEIILKFNSMRKFIFITLFSFIGCSENIEIELAGNLSPLYTFANGIDDYLVNPVGFATNGNDMIFVSDNLPSQIKKYSFSGDFNGVFGRRGQGPGEFVSPTGLDFLDNNLFIEDRGNLRFKRLSDSGEVKNIYAHQYPYVEFVVSQNSIYTFSPPSFFITGDLEERDLITVYDQVGNIINSFGEYISFPENIPAGMSWPYLKFENDLLHVAFQYFPIYRIYTKDGELINEFDLSLYTNEDLEANYYGKNYSDPTSPSMDVAFRALYVDNDTVYVARQSENIHIDKFLLNEEGMEFQKTFSFIKNDQIVVVQDFFFHKPSETFFILEYNGEAHQITRYEIIHS